MISIRPKGLVASIREIVDKKDSFIRMKQERDAERDKRLAKKQAERTAAVEKQAKIEEVSRRLSALFGMNDKPHERESS